MTPKKKPDVWPGMTAVQHEALSRYFRATADAVGLTSWEIDLADEPIEGENLAAVNCTFGRLHAAVIVARDWMEQPLEERRQAVMHELVHVMTDRVEQSFSDMEALMAPQVYTLAFNTFRTNVEYAVDEIARQLVKFSDDSNIIHLLEGRLEP